MYLKCLNNSKSRNKQKDSWAAQIYKFHGFYIEKCFLMCSYFAPMFIRLVILASLLQKIRSIRLESETQWAPSQVSASLHSKEIRNAIKSWPITPKHNIQKQSNSGKQTNVSNRAWEGHQTQEVYLLKCKVN